MNNLYAVEVGTLSNSEALLQFLREIKAEDLAYLIRHDVHDPELEARGLTIIRKREVMYCDLGKPNPSWIPGLTEMDSDGRHEWRSYIDSGNAFVFMGYAHLQGTGNANLKFILDYSQQLDLFIKHFNLKADWIHSVVA